MEKNSRIYVAGHTGLVGSAIFRALKRHGYTNIITRTHKEADLTEQKAVNELFEKEKPEYVFMAAAKVGGIVINSLYPADFFYQNMMIGVNVVNASHKYGVKKLLNLASSCIYPKEVPQPMKEEYLLTSDMEKSNEGYAIAKIAVLKMCHYYHKQFGDNFITAMPASQYGIGDNFNMQTAHLLPMTMRRMHLAKMLSENDFDGIRINFRTWPIGWGIDSSVDFSSTESLEKTCNTLGAYRDKVIAWGTGQSFREFMNSDDLAEACLFLMNSTDAKDIGEFINLGVGADEKIENLLLMIKDISGFSGRLEFDPKKPDGVFRKLLDSSKMKKIGIKIERDLRQGLADFYKYYLSCQGK